jgi:hypothetical protein
MAATAAMLFASLDFGSTSAVGMSGRSSAATRGLGMNPAQRKRLDAHPNSTVSMARRELAKMYQGLPQERWAPPAHLFPVVANIPWMNGPGRIPRVLVWADDMVEPADDA